MALTKPAPLESRKPLESLNWRERLMDLRHALGWSLEQLAAALGSDRYNLGRTALRPRRPYYPYLSTIRRIRRLESMYAEELEYFRERPIARTRFRVHTKLVRIPFSSEYVKRNVVRLKRGIRPAPYPKKAWRDTGLENVVAASQVTNAPFSAQVETAITRTNGNPGVSPLSRDHHAPLERGRVVVDHPAQQAILALKRRQRTGRLRAGVDQTRV